MFVDFNFTEHEYTAACKAVEEGRRPCIEIKCNGQYCSGCPLAVFFQKYCPTKEELNAGLYYIKSHIKKGN